MSVRYEVCPVDELPPGEREIIEIEEPPHSIGVFNVDGEFYALANVCPHQLGPLCEGRITGEMVSERVGDFQLIRDGEVVQCPWHGWKFNIADGTSVFNPHKLSTPTYETSVEKPREEIEEEVEEYGTALSGDEPPIDTYQTEVEEEIIVVYV